jgi:aspartate beta-hydroxylase
MTNAARGAPAPGQGVDALKAAADRALMANDAKGARELFEQAVALNPARFDLWIGLAAALRGLGDMQAAVGALDQALSIDPRSFPALLMKASLLEQLGAPHQAGAAYGIALTQLPLADRMSPQMRAAADRAKDIHLRYEAAMAQALRGDLADIQTAIGGPAARRLDQFIDQLAGRRKVYHQEPVLFHYPGLPEIEFIDREDLPFIAEFESHTAGIVADLAGVLAEDAGELEPYVNYPPNVPLDQWAELNRSPRWSGYHLLENGKPVEAHCRRCPRTMAAIALLPQPTVQGRSPAAMFSVLQPHTRIPPHHGVANTRLVLHLPLVVPPGCGFRVGNETRAWKVGEAWVFDDTIEHEAWNNSDQLRTILICDIWNPYLAEEERAMVAAVMAAMDDFSGGVEDAGL